MVLFRWQYSAIHGEVCNLGASFDVITQMLEGLIAVETFHLSHHLQNILVFRNVLSGRFLNSFS